MSIVVEEYEKVVEVFYTFQDLVDLGEKYPDYIFKFEGTNYSPSCIASWRGSYSLPSLEYDTKDMTGAEMASMIREDINGTHEGYKGGEYQYNLAYSPYISAYSRCEKHKVVGYGVGDGVVYLLTEIDPY